MNKAISLLREIKNYNEGEGEFDFSKYSKRDKDNARFDAWERIREKINELLEEKEL